MKKLFFLCAILISTLSYGQVPDDFNVLYYENADSSLLILSKMAKQQKNPPISVDVAKESISQSRNKASISGLSNLDLSRYVSQISIYFENITDVEVTEGSNWRITYSSKITKQSDIILLHNKEMAEQAFAALLCLIKSSGNKNYDQIMTNALKK